MCFTAMKVRRFREIEIIVNRAHDCLDLPPHGMVGDWERDLYITLKELTLYCHWTSDKLPTLHTVDLLLFHA